MNKLTIGIPTFNRFQDLKKTVNFFIEEGVLGNPDVEFLISDNSSSDNTQDYLLELKESYNNIIINRNAFNIGAEGNFCRIIELSNSQYVWIVGDDDELQKGVVSRVISLLKKYNPSWLFIRHIFVQSDAKVIPSLDCDSFYSKGIDLFNLICQSDYKLGGLMFVSSSVHLTKNARSAIDFFKGSSESKYNNMALTLGLAFNSAVHGSACITDLEEIENNCYIGNWVSKIIKVNCRDQIAILDLFAKKNNVNLLKETKFEDGLLYKCPEWVYFRSSFKETNVAMRYYLKHRPIKVIKDFFVLLFKRKRRD